MASNPFVHVELQTKEIDRAKKFYENVFDWELEDMPMGNGMSYTGIKVEGTLSIGTDSTSISSTAAPPGHVVAYFLGLLSKPKREAVLRDLPAAVAKARGEFPGIDADRLEEAERLLTRLRARKSVKVSGTVVFKFGK